MVLWFSSGIGQPSRASVLGLQCGDVKGGKTFYEVNPVGAPYVTGFIALGRD
jgi:hypothetical protein